jgi:hypothetical protein
MNCIILLLIIFHEINFIIRNNEFTYVYAEYYRDGNLGSCMRRYARSLSREREAAYRTPALRFDERSRDPR